MSRSVAIIFGLSGACAALLSLTLAGVAFAQVPGGRGETVTWTATAQSPVKPGGKVSLTLKGAVQDGWHVYSLKQLPRGPTSLHVALDTTAVAAAAGAPTGSPPVKLLDPAFGLETQFYAKDFTLTVPVKIGSGVAAGPQQIPVSVRFQTCNGDICQPPKTVHLSVPLAVQAAG